MDQKAKPGNPKIHEASLATRWPAISPGEKSERVNFRFPDSLVRRLEAMANETGSSKSELARKAMEQFLENAGY
ncbi:MAG TPA: ribbon-helix-helix domain-containing protein [Methylococcales bacterium]